MILEPIKVLERLSNYHSENNTKTSLLSQYRNDLDKQPLSYSWTHAGKLSMTIAELTTLIDHMHTKPVRTGHIGNWQEIAAGRAGALDHNGVVCGKKQLGRPLITEFTQTENTDMNKGDIVYLPGSVINERKRSLLPLFTWNGTQFIERSRESSYFVPFTLTEQEGKLISLVDFHRKNCLLYNKTQFISNIVISKRATFKKILKGLIDYISENNNCSIKLNDIIDRTVTTTGILTRENVTLSGTYFIHGDYHYSNSDELAEATLLPFYAANNPTEFFNNIADMPSTMPCISLAFSCALDYALQGENLMTPLNLYLEWGAYDSAGLPSFSNGYYKKKSILINKIYQLILQLFPEIAPVHYVLLPSAIFNLLPNSAYPQDAYYINTLIADIINDLPQKAAPELMLNHIKLAVYSWLECHKKKLSHYYLGKFSQARCIYPESHYHTHGEPIDLPAFEQLTIQQACMITGALHELAKPVVQQKQ